MPVDNGFAHQEYTPDKPRTEFELDQPPPPETAGTAEFDATMRVATSALRSANVAAVFLVHGTLVGTDALGVMRGLSHIVPGFADYFGRQEKVLVDAFMGDTANYSEDYANVLATCLNEGVQPAARVQRFIWSSENHHLGRSEAAVRLIHEIIQLELMDDQRVLLLGHSHSGNVFALISNLLGSNQNSVDRFFRAMGRASQPPIDTVDSLNAEQWKRVRAKLASPSRADLAKRLDLVTLGTPIRYGWETRGYGKLLHFVNHHPTTGLEEYRVPFPLSLEQFITSECGDFIQQFFIAGTNLPLSVFAWKMWRMEQRLGRLLQRGQPRRKLWERLKCGQRVPSEGTCLLVDYALADESSGRSVLGHGVYTRLEWMGYHMSQIAHRFYAEPGIKDTA